LLVVAAHAELVETLELACRWARPPERSGGARAVSALDPDAVDEQWASAAFVSLASLLDDSYLRKA